MLDLLVLGMRRGGGVGAEDDDGCWGDNGLSGVLGMMVGCGVMWWLGVGHDSK